MNKRDFSKLMRGLDNAVRSAEASISVASACEAWMARPHKGVWLSRPPHQSVVDRALEKGWVVAVPLRNGKQAFHLTPKGSAAVKSAKG